MITSTRKHIYTCSIRKYKFFAPTHLPPLTAVRRNGALPGAAPFAAEVNERFALESWLGVSLALTLRIAFAK